jgi:UDP-N-acetyl-D-mannosaminuronic acid dehydrogenase
MSFETVSVIGLGYIGLPTAAMFASRKKKVIGVDVNQKTVDTINRGEIHIVEPDLDMIVHAAVTEGYLRAVTAPEPADAFLIAVPTPFKSGAEGDVPEPDLSFIQSAVKAIAPVLEKGNLVILESTSPVGTTEQMASWLAELRPDLNFPCAESKRFDINVAHCPERVLPGYVVRELVENDRVVGGMTPCCSRRSIELYKSFVVGECVITNARTAEMAKLTENASRDVSIAFANELSVVCDKLDINVWELISLANRHPRVNILQPGPGVGGHCIAVDPWFIVNSAPEQTRLIHAARMINDDKPAWVVNKVKAAVADLLIENPEKAVKEVTIACLGLVFKADIDDLRESPAMWITEQLVQLFPQRCIAVEPNIEMIPPRIEGLARLLGLNDAMQQADIVVLLVDHKEFKQIDKKILSDKIVIDTRGVWAS